MFSRVAIVNRGEAAMRLIHAVRELSAETGTRIETVALYTDADRAATFVRAADLSYHLGPAAARPYLDLAVLERALRDSGADAAWVGWGFVAEDPAFAELCDRLGVTFVGPAAEAMRQLGDKIGAKLIAEQVGVPVAPWSRGAVGDLDTAVRVAGEIGYPLMLKATAGGGGRGIRVIMSAEQLTEAYQRTRMEAERAFGSGVVFLERLLTGARHVEVQVHRGRPGHGVGAGRAGLLGAAAQPEGDRGVRVAGADRGAGRPAQGGRRAAGAGGRVPGRGHRRVPVPAGRAAVRLPGGEHPAAGRAPGHRADHRD